MNGTKLRILIVEDEEAIAESVAYNLRREGFEAEMALDGPAALRQALNRPPDLILLDLMLPGIDGLEVCRTLRKRVKAPIIMLTAKAEEMDKVVGLEVGADDYVTKPFSMKELMARVRAVLRRTGQLAWDDAAVLRAGPLEMDTERYRVTLRGDPLQLALKEFKLLEMLLRHRGRVLSRDQLLETVWGDSEYRDTHTVDVHIRWLRTKIEDDPSHPRCILTVRGVGYKFAE
jgi:two-component system response regulator RegX3